jgi:hypothetical protein
MNSIPWVCRTDFIPMSVLGETHDARRGAMDFAADRSARFAGGELGFLVSGRDRAMHGRRRGSLFHCCLPKRTVESTS